MAWGFGSAAKRQPPDRLADDRALHAHSEPAEPAREILAPDFPADHSSPSPVTAQSPAAIAAPDAPAEPSPEATQRMAALRRLSGHLGDLVALLLQAPQFRAMPLAELETLVLPGLASRQYLVLEAEDAATGMRGAIAAALWARVSEPVEAHIIEGALAGRPSRLSAADWTSGDRCWLVAAVGAEQAVAVLMGKLKEGPFAATELRLGAGRGEDGAVRVGRL
jgi:hemolysin-activating ACP:hemolysin acyltransferase